MKVENHNLKLKRAELFELNSNLKQEIKDKESQLEVQIHRLNVIEEEY